MGDPREEREAPLDPVERDDKSPSSSGTSCTEGSSGAPDGNLVDIVDEYVQAGCNEGSRILWCNAKSSTSVASGTVTDVLLDCRVACVAVLRLVDGRLFLGGFRLLAFLRLDVHHISRSSTTELIEPLELLELLIEGSADGVNRSRAILSLRSPTFSAPSPSVHDKSAANMVNGGKIAGVRLQKTHH
jgi:hypothetical protein